MPYSSADERTVHMGYVFAESVTVRQQSCHKHTHLPANPFL
jgi:hypothetical protein